MDFRSLLQSLDTLNEADVKHKGTYGTSHGKEDVRDQYGHRIGKVNKDADTKKDAPKKGRGRPKKGSDDSGEVKSYDTKSLHNVFGGGKKPSKEVGKTSKKHSLKEYIEEVATTKQLDEDNQFRTQPVPQQNKQMQMVTGPDGKPVLDQPVPTDTALRVANALNVSDVSEEMDEGSIQGGVWTATPPKPGQPNVPAPSGDPEGVPSSKVIRPTTTTKTPSPSISQPMGTIKGGVWTADPPKAGEKGVPAPVPIDEESLDEKAVSKAQQRFMGMVHAAQKGEKPASPEVAKVAKDMGKKDAKDFASTKHKGLPDHVKEDKVDLDNEDLPSAAVPGVSAESVLPKRTNEILWTATGKVCEGRPFVERVKMYEKKGGGWRMGKQRDEQVYNNLKEFYTNEIQPRKEAKEILVRRRMGEAVPDVVGDKQFQDHEVSMARASLVNIGRAVQELLGKIGNQEKNLPGWIQDHITNAENYIMQASSNYHDGSDEKLQGNDITGPIQAKHTA